MRAASWRIEAKTDGAVALNPVTGTINAGGKIQSAPIVLSLNAPFGGKAITWSSVRLDADGNQVATGMFAANDKPLLDISTGQPRIDPT